MAALKDWDALAGVAKALAAILPDEAAQPQ
jgi:hypothetical protein